MRLVSPQCAVAGVPNHYTVCAPSWCFFPPQFIKIAQFLLECSNFNSLFAIISGLAAPCVSRLKKTWSGVTSKVCVCVCVCVSEECVCVCE